MKNRDYERILILAAAYFAAGYIGLKFPYFESTVTLIWPPTGIALAALLCWGMRVWPGVALGAFAVNLTTGVPLETVILISIGNTLCGATGAYLIREFSAGRHLNSLKSLALFLVFGVAASPLVSSLNGAATISLTLSGDWSGFRDVWWGWWVGDLMGVLLFAPPLLQIAKLPWKGKPLHWHAELMLLALGAIALSGLVHSTDILARQEFLFIFVSVPFALWGALRFGVLGAAIVNICVSTVAIAFLTVGASFFLQGDQQDNLVRFYGYFSVVGCGGLILAGAIESLMARQGAEAGDIVSRKLTRLRIAFAITAGAFGLALSIAAATVTHDQLNRTTQLEFERFVLSFESNLRLTLEDSVDPLFAIKSLFENQDDMSSETFDAMVTPWLSRNDTLLALEWLPSVTSADRTAFTAEVRSAERPDFDIRERREGALVSAAERPTYYPVRYVVPLRGNEAVVGFDLGSSPERYDALQAAIAYGDAAMTEPIQLVQDGGTRLGVLVMLPAYGGDLDQVLGFALGVYRLDDLLKTVHRRSAIPEDVAIHVVDAGASDDRAQIYSSTGLAPNQIRRTADRVAESGGGATGELSFGARRWTIVAEPNAGSFNLIWHWEPWAVLVFGSILSGILAFYLLSLTRTEAQIARLVEERTQLLESTKREAEEAMRQAKLASRAKSEFLAHMSHELRSPLNAILGYADLLLKGPPLHEDPKRTRTHVETIISSGRHLLSLIGDILDLSKIEAGQMSLERIAFDLRQVIEELVSIMALPADERNNTLRLEVPDNLHRWVTGDPVRVRQVLMNFLSNSVKFTDNGTIEVRIARKSEDDREMRLRFSIVDDGIGIPADKQAGIFDAFSQADLSTTRQYGGSGLGLAINKQLVKAMGGEIGLWSKEGIGSEFWFEITLLKAEPQDPEQEAEDEEELDVPPMSLLVVEDIEVNRIMAQMMLENAGHRVETAENGAVAVEQVEKDQFDAVLMDVHMPVMDGLAATAAIRQLEDPVRRAVPIIALTADIASSNIQICLDAGMNHYCPKPFNMKALSKILRNLDQADSTIDTARVTDHVPDPKPVAKPVPEPVADAEVPLVDLPRFNEVMAGSDALLTMFARKSREIMAEIDASQGGNGAEFPAQAVHSLKGMSANMGFARLAGACADLEVRAKDPAADPERIAKDLTDLGRVLKKTVLAAKGAIEDRSAAP